LVNPTVQQRDADEVMAAIEKVTVACRKAQEVERRGGC
jgi:hypothetical protein